MTYDSLFDPPSGKGNKGYVPCYHSHPALKLPGDFLIYGGSAATPAVKDADIYLSLDGFTGAKYRPWAATTGPLIATFPIEDRKAPKDPEDFKVMIDWLCNQLHAGKKVHVGCMGGHGRTGTVLAAVAAKLGEVDAITYVRTNYCQKAVESGVQVDFLVKHFGVTKVKGSDKPGKYHDDVDLSGDRYPAFPKVKLTYQRDRFSDGTKWEVVTYGKSAKALWPV